jgi:cytoskeletal protein RodZ
MQSHEQPASLSEKFQGFGAVPSDALWGNIAAAIEEKEKRRGFFWWWTGIGVAASLIGGFFIYQGFFMNPTETTQLSTLKPANNQLQNRFEPQIASTETDELLTLDSSDKTQNQKEEKPIDKKQIPNNQKLPNRVDKKDVVKFEKQILKNSKSEELVTSSILKLPVNATELLVLDLGQKPNLEGCFIRQKQYRPWEFGFDVGYYTDLNIGPKADAVSGVADQEVNSDLFIEGQYNSVPDQLGTSFAAVVPSSQSSVSKNMNANFYAGKYLSKRWMFNTGLGYSRSTYNTIYNNGFLVSPKTTITSLIVPVGFSLDAIQKPKFKLRPALLFNNEFAVFERVKTDVLMAEAIPSNLVKGYSASMELSLGHLFRIRPRVALSVSPSFRYYLRQNIQSQNYLIKQNSWIGGKIGMIWTL